jgi:peptide alpha-N-acetyltransferase
VCCLFSLSSLLNLFRSCSSTFIHSCFSAVAVFTYRYFLHRFPELCILAVPKDSGEPIGCVVGKIDREEIILHGSTRSVPTGYIGMLAVQSSYRRQGIGKALVRRVLERMKEMGCTSVTLETEVSNVTAQHLYQNSFGFVREELLVRYYLNWGDAYRLRLWF